jgi:hypothetical protein
MYGIMRSFFVRKKILSENFSRHNKKTAKAGKNAVSQNTLNKRSFNCQGVIPANSYGKSSMSSKKIYVGINKGCKI